MAVEGQGSSDEWNESGRQVTDKWQTSGFQVASMTGSKKAQPQPKSPIRSDSGAPETTRHQLPRPFQLARAHAQARRAMREGWDQAAADDLSDSRPLSSIRDYLAPPLQSRLLSTPYTPSNSDMFASSTINS